MDVAAAIADPVRRDILALLRRGPLPAGAIAQQFAISRPAVSRHLRVLREAGLVVARVQGRQRVYRLEVAPLAELDAWLAPFRAGPPGLGARVEAGLDALDTEVRRTVRGRRAAGAGAARTNGVGATDATDGTDATGGTDGPDGPGATDTATDTEERTA